MSNNLKVVTIIGDSVPQVSAEFGVFLKDTYPFKLQEMLHDTYWVCLRSKGGNHVLKQSTEDSLKADVLFSGSEVVIVHLGIVDCAPRLFGLVQERVMSVLMKLPGIRLAARSLIKFKSKHRRFFTQHFKKTYVSKKDFQKHYHHIIERVKSINPKQILLVNIADTSDKNKHRSYGFEQNIRDYNEIIKEIAIKNGDVCTLVDFYAKTRENAQLITKDEGIHLTKEGHLLLAELLYKNIKQ